MNDINISHGRAWIDQEAGVRIGYAVATAEPEPRMTVVLLHGAPQTRYAWRKVLDPLARAGYRVIAPDYRGAGASSKPRDGYDKWTMARDIHDLVHDHLGIEGPISLVGHDIGSMLALGYALRYRHDLVSATFMEAQLPGTDYYAQRKTASRTSPYISPTGRERWCINRFYDDLTYQPDAIATDDLDVYARAFEAPGAMRALCEIYRELNRDAEIHRAQLNAHGKLTVPVLASGGNAQPSRRTTRRCATRSRRTSPDGSFPAAGTGSPRRSRRSSSSSSWSSIPPYDLADPTAADMSAQGAQTTFSMASNRGDVVERRIVL